MATSKKPTLELVDDFLAEAILIPIRGKKYRFEAVGMKTALKLEAHMNAAQAQLDKGVTLESIELDQGDDTEDEYKRGIFGDTYGQMLEDDLPTPTVDHVLAIILAWTFSGFDRAKEYYDTGGKVQAANRAARRTATPTRKAAANTTPKRASATGTKPKTGSNGRKS